MLFAKVVFSHMYFKTTYRTIMSMIVVLGETDIQFKACSMVVVTMFVTTQKCDQVTVL